MYLSTGKKNLHAILRFAADLGIRRVVDVNMSSTNLSPLVIEVG